MEISFVWFCNCYINIASVQSLQQYQEMNFKSENFPKMYILWYILCDCRVLIVVTLPEKQWSSHVSMLSCAQVTGPLSLSPGCSIHPVCLHCHKSHKFSQYHPNFHIYAAIQKITKIKVVIAVGMGKNNCYWGTFCVKFCRIRKQQLRGKNTLQHFLQKVWLCSKLFLIFSKVLMLAHIK